MASILVSSDADADNGHSDPTNAGKQIDLTEF
jgi:hypothetical protein